MRKVQITLNNPVEHQMPHSRIKEEMKELTSTVYYIMCDEIGGKEKTLHTHLYAVFRSPVRFSTLKRHFPNAHIEKAVSTHQSNIDYVKKSGKWANTEKEATSIPNTLEEWGECPPDSRSSDAHFQELYTYIKDGLTDYEILERDASYMRNLTDINRARLLVRQAQYVDEFRHLEVTYIWGKTGAGKSRYVMDTYGYQNVFRVTDYTHPWDTYAGQDVVVFEEYMGNFTIQKFNNYADGYPLKLEARYSDKQACYTKLFIISNIDLGKQYPHVREEEPSVWQAFIRRIHKVMWFQNAEKVQIYYSTEDYFSQRPACVTSAASLLSQVAAGADDPAGDGSGKDTVDELFSLEKPVPFS